MCLNNSQRNECKLVAWITHVDEESESALGFIVRQQQQQLLWPHCFLQITSLKPLEFVPLVRYLYFVLFS